MRVPVPLVRSRAEGGHKIAPDVARRDARRGSPQDPRTPKGLCATRRATPFGAHLVGPIWEPWERYLNKPDAVPASRQRTRLPFGRVPPIFRVSRGSMPCREGR